MYQNTMFVTIAQGITQADVDAAENAALNVGDSGEKIRLMNLLNEAHQQFDTNTNVQLRQQNEAARKAVNGLFNNDTPTSGAVKSNLTQSAIDAAKNLVNQLVDSTVKANMQKDLDKAQNLLNASKPPVNFDITVAPFKLGKDNYVTGQFSGDIAKISLTVNNNAEGSKINVTAPDFKYYANNVIRSQTDIVILKAYDGNGKLLVTKTVTVTKDAPALVPTGAISSITPFQLGKDSYITGTFTGDIVKVELQVNKAPLQRINVTGGTIKYYAKPNITKTTDVVELVAFNAAGEAVSSKEVTFASTGTTNGDVTVNPFLLGKDGYVKGQCKLTF
ncbi:immunoglobulin-like domain-containing protein, partial [Listeria cornellensis]